MKILLILISLFILSSCKDNIETNPNCRVTTPNGEWLCSSPYLQILNDYNYIEQTTGLKVNFYGLEVKNTYRFLAAWQEITECSRLHSNIMPNILIVLSIKDIDSNISIDGLFYSQTNLIILTEYFSINGLIAQHEMLHFLLINNGYYNESMTHSHYLFEQCVPGTILN